MRISNADKKREYVIDMLSTAGEKHAATVNLLLSQDEYGPRSFKAFLHQTINNKPEEVDDAWAFEKIVSTIEDYILHYHAPASAKQRLHDALYSLCEDLAQSRNIVGYKNHLDLLEKPVAEDINITLIKALHEREGITKEEFALSCKVHQKTVQNKIQALNGNPKYEPLRIGGFAVHVPVADPKERKNEPYRRDENRRYYTPDTMNPLVLQLNTTQTATLLQSLYYNNYKEENYLPLDLAVDIWCQLSEYTKERIREAFGRDDPDFKNFLEWIQDEVESLTHHFMSESEVLDNRDLSEYEMMVIAEKGGEICDIELKAPLRSRSRQRVMYDHEQHRYYAVSADHPDEEPLYFTKDELGQIRRCL